MKRMCQDKVMFFGIKVYRTHARNYSERYGFYKRYKKSRVRYTDKDAKEVSCSFLKEFISHEVPKVPDFNIDRENDNREFLNKLEELAINGIEIPKYNIMEGME